MRVIILILLCLTYTISFSQSRFVIESSFSEHQAKEFMQRIEEHIPNTFMRNMLANRIEFGTPRDYTLAEIESVMDLVGMENPHVSKAMIQELVVEKAGGTDCELAEQLCSNSSLPGNSSGFGTQELSGANRGCLTGNEHQSSWYYLNVLTGGTLQMRINPNAAADYDFAIWGPFTAATANANCPPITNPIRCSFAAGNGNTGIRSGEPDNSEDAFGDRWVNALTVSAGQVYIMVIDNFNASGVGYSIDFSWGLNLSTAILGCTPVVLPVELSDFKGKSVSGVNELKWSTETELDNDYFVVESTTDPAADIWEKVETIDGVGNSESHNDYSLNVYNYARNTINYYRLKQVDMNGQIRTYPYVVSVDNRMKDQKLVKIVNLLGQEVSESEKGLVIYVYDDGTQEKRFN
ncbi:MAG: hypothetical protein ACO1N0_21710 [Fluviicola sp.]